MSTVSPKRTAYTFCPRGLHSPVHRAVWTAAGGGRGAFSAGTPPARGCGAGGKSARGRRRGKSVRCPWRRGKSAGHGRQRQDLGKSVRRPGNHPRRTAAREYLQPRRRANPRSHGRATHKTAALRLCRPRTHPGAAGKAADRRKPPRPTCAFSGPRSRRQSAGRPRSSCRSCRTRSSQWCGRCGRTGTQSAYTAGSACGGTDTWRSAAA